MDGISNAAAVIGLVQAGIQATTTLNRYISRVKKAESSCAKLLDQIKLMSAVEEAIRTTIQSPSPSFPGYSRDLQNAIDELFKENGPLNKCKVQLEELSKWLESQVESNKYKKLIKKMGWPAKEDKIEETIQAFNQHMPYIDRILWLVDHDTTVNAPTVVVKPEHATPKQSELLSWFDGFDCTNKQESTFRQQRQKTGEWLFKEELYKAWRTGSTKFIWLHGKPGAGKSVLASAVIYDLLNAPKDETLAYFYCDFRNPRCTSAKEILRSLTKQLLYSSKKEWLSSFSDLITRKERGAGPPTDLRLLLDLLKRAAALHERPIMVIDALDECDEDLPNLLDGLIELVHADYRLFVTSRTLPKIEDAFRNLSAIFLDEHVDEVHEDIYLHITVELAWRSRLKDLGQDLKDEIQDTLMEKVDGMFRWVQCQLDRLNDCCSVGDIHEVLDTLPETLHETYDQMLHTIDKKPFGARIARRALMWLVTAIKPLGSRQLVEALTLSSDEPAWDSTRAPLDEHVILEILGSFVVIDHTDNVITLSHYSVKEYLTSDTLAYSAYYVHSSDASFELAKASIFALILHQGDKNNLSFYADSDGLEHLKDCDATHNEALVGHLLALQDRISSTGPGSELLRNSWDNPWMVRVQQVALHIILRYGHLSMLSHYLDHHPVQATPEDNPLVFAACDSSMALAGVQLLVEKGLDINLEGPMYTYSYVHRMSPLTAAARHRIRECQEPLVQFFLENGCVVSRDAVYIILSSSRFSPCDPSVVRVLLDRGADPKLLGAGNNSCLHLLFGSYGMSLEDQLEIAQILVEHGCDPSALNDNGYSPLIAAARHFMREWQECSIQFLLANGCAVPTEAIHATLSHRSYTPCNPAVIRVLLAHGADPKILAAGNNSSLYLLFESGGIFPEDKLEIAQILIDNGCDPVAPNDKGHSPLIAAARSSIREGQECFVRFLLANGCTVPTDAIHATLSHRSHTPCNPAVIRVLLAHGADPKILAAGNNSSLYLLFESGGISPEDKLEIAQILIDNGCDPVAPNDKGHSPLIAAARSSIREGQECFVRFLLANGCTVPTDAIHATLSHRSYTPCNPAVIRVLLAHGADPKILAAGNNSSLYLLFESGGISLEDQLEIAQILIDNGCDPAALNKKGCSPLIAAARSGMREGQERLVQFLLAHGCTVPINAIHATLSHGIYGPYNPAVVLVLLAHGADPTLLTAGNDSSLHLLFESGGISPEDRLKIARILVENGCNPIAPNDWGRLPFHHVILHVRHYCINIEELHPTLRFLVGNGTLPNSRDKDGCNALHLLCENNHSLDYASFAYTLQLLVDFGCDINSQNKDGKTPFHLAVSCSYSSRVVDLFISQKAEIPVDVVNHVVAYNRPCKDGQNSEVIAALTILKESGASFQSRTKDGENALHCLLQYPDSDSLESILAIATFLIESGCDIHTSYDGVTPLELAIENGQFPVAEALLARVASGPGSHGEPAELVHDDSMGNSILKRLCHSESECKFMDKVKFLQEIGYDLAKDVNRRNYNGSTPLCAALSRFRADPEMVTSLLAFGASFNHVNYVYLDNIQWASNLAWYHDATNAHKRYVSRSNISCNDVVLVQNLLGMAYGCRLSPAVVGSILDMAEYWACVKVIKYNIQYDEATHRDNHIAFLVIPAEMRGWIPRRVVLACKSNAKLGDSEGYDIVAFSRFHVTRGGVKFRLPNSTYLALPSLPHTDFVTWNEFRPALHEDAEQKIMLAELLPGDMLCVEFEVFPQDDNYALEFLQMDVYYSINSLSDERN